MQGAKLMPQSEIRPISQAGSAHSCARFGPAHGFFPQQQHPKSVELNLEAPCSPGIAEQSHVKRPPPGPARPHSITRVKHRTVRPPPGTPGLSPFDASVALMCPHRSHLISHLPLRSSLPPYLPASPPRRPRRLPPLLPLLLLLLLERRGCGLHVAARPLPRRLQRAGVHAVRRAVGVREGGQPAPQVTGAAPAQHHIPTEGGARNESSTLTRRARWRGGGKDTRPPDHPSARICHSVQYDPFKTPTSPHPKPTAHPPPPLLTCTPPAAAPRPAAPRPPAPAAVCAHPHAAGRAGRTRLGVGGGGRVGGGRGGGGRVGVPLAG